MESLDNQQQIWQRVRKNWQPEQGLDLRALILSAGETEVALRRTAGLLGGAQRQQVLALAIGAAEEVSILRGIYRLDTGKILPFKPQSPSGGSALTLLRECYFRSLKTQREYMARTLEPQFGGIFQSLAQRMGDRCQAIARILGTI